MFDPIDNSWMCNPCHPGNSSNTHTVNVYSQAQPLDIIAVSSWVRRFDELTATSNANIVLLASSMAIFADMLAGIVRILHRLNYHRF